MEAGSITIRIKGDITDLQSAMDKMNAQLNNSKKNTESVFSGLLKFDVLKNVFTTVAGSIMDMGKSFIQGASNVENLTQSFKTMLGSGEKAKILVTQLRQFANVTPFNTEDLAKATQTMLAFGISSQDVMSNLKMLGDVAGNSSQKLDSLSLVFGQISSAGKLQGQDLLQLINVGFNPLQILSQKTGQSMSDLRKQMEQGKIGIDQVKEAFKIATSEGGLFFNNMQTQSQTLTGKISTMQDAFMMVGSTIGTAMLPFLKSLTDESTKFADTINQFLSSAKGIEIISNIMGNVAATWNIIKTIAIELGNNLKTYLSSIISTIADNFKKLFDNSNKLNPVMLVLSGAVNTISIGMAISAKVVKLLIDYISDFIGIIKAGADVILKFGTVMTDPFNEKKRKEFSDSLTKMGDSFLNFGKNLVINTVDIVDTTVKEFSKLGNNITKDAEKWTSDYNKILTKTKEETKNVLSDLTSAGTGDITQQTTTPSSKPSSSTKGKGIKIELDIGLLEESINTVAGLLGTFTNNVSTSISNGISKVSDAFVEFKKVSDDAQSTQTQKWASFGQIVSGIATSIGSAFTSVFQLINQSLKSSFDEQISNLQSVHDTEIEMITKRLENEMELIENDGLTKSQKREEEMASLQAQINVETDEKKKANLQQQLSELEKEKKITEAKLKADKDKAQSDYKLAKSTYDLQKQQFEINKAMQIVQATISYALGLVQLWANVWSIGNPIAAAVLGGVMTGVLTGIFASQVALIASSQFPSQAPSPPAFATGTANFRGGRAIVGEMGAEEIELPAGANVNPAGMTAWNREPQIINLIIDGDVIKTWQVNQQRVNSLY